MELAPAYWQMRDLYGLINPSPLVVSNIVWSDRLFSIEITKRLHTAYVVAWAVVIAALIVMAGVSFASPSWDEVVYTYVGKGILEGEIPYADRWDNKGPVTYVTYALGSVLPGRWGIWLISMVFLLGSAFLCFKTAQREFGTTAALFSAATLVIYATKLGGGGGFTESYALLFQLLALYLYLGAVRQKGPGPRLCITLGVLGALSFLLRANLVGVWLTIGICWISRWRASSHYILWSTVGGLAVLAMAFMTFLYLGAWDDLWSATVLYNYAHSAATLEERIRATMLMVWNLSPVVPLFGIGWCVGVWYHFSGRSRGEPLERVLPFLLILGPVEVALSLVSGNGWDHYYIPILPAGVLYLGFLVWLVSRERLAAPALMAFLVLFATVNYHTDMYSKGYDLVKTLLNTDDSTALTARDRDLRVAEIVERYSGPDDTILVWGTAPQLYLLTGRNAPTRFFYQYPLFKKGYWKESHIAEFFFDVTSTPPAVIVDGRNHSIPPLDEASRKDWSPRLRQYVYESTRFQMFFDYVRAEYELKEVVGRHWVYVARK